MKDVAYDIIYEHESTHWWYRVRRHIVGSILRTKAQKYSRPLNILDIGCGTGLLMKEMGRYGQVEGVDISERAVAYCKQRGLSPVVGSADALPFKDNTFDIAVILDVLEHLPDDKKGCEELYRVLAQGGSAVIAVPAFMFLWSVTDEVSNHYRRYTKKEIIACLKTAGFSIERATYFNTFLFLPILAVRSAVRLFRIPMKSENTVGGPLINTSLYSIFSAESKLLPYVNYPFGVSILIIASKS